MKYISMLFMINFLGGCVDNPNIIKEDIAPAITDPKVHAGDENSAVTRHNEIRSEQFINSDLRWSVELAESAQTYANSMGTSGKWEHDSNNDAYGENLFTASYQVNYVDAINSWYDEKSYYNYVENSCQSGKVCGHYTQMIWKDSTEVGCGIAKYTTGSYRGWLVIVCRYNPPGNYVGEQPY